MPLAACPPVFMTRLGQALNHFCRSQGLLHGEERGARQVGPTAVRPLEATTFIQPNRLLQTMALCSGTNAGFRAHPRILPRKPQATRRYPGHPRHHRHRPAAGVREHRSSELVAHALVHHHASIRGSETSRMGGMGKRQLTRAARGNTGKQVCPCHPAHKTTCDHTPGGLASQGQ